MNKLSIYRNNWQQLQVAFLVVVFVNVLDYYLAKGYSSGYEMTKKVILRYYT